MNTDVLWDYILGTQLILNDWKTNGPEKDLDEILIPFYFSSGTWALSVKMEKTYMCLRT